MRLANFIFFQFQTKDILVLQLTIQSTVILKGCFERHMVSEFFLILHPSFTLHCKVGYLDRKLFLRLRQLLRTCRLVMHLIISSQLISVFAPRTRLQTPDKNEFNHFYEEPEAADSLVFFFSFTVLNSS